MAFFPLSFVLLAFAGCAALSPEAYETGMQIVEGVKGIARYVPGGQVVADGLSLLGLAAGLFVAKKGSGRLLAGVRNAPEGKLWGKGEKA